jgi:hypothetical protein
VCEPLAEAAWLGAVVLAGASLVEDLAVAGWAVGAGDETDLDRGAETGFNMVAVGAMNELPASCIALFPPELESIFFKFFIGRFVSGLTGESEHLDTRARKIHPQTAVAPR